MNKKPEMLKEGIIVTLGSFVTLAVAFVLYFLIFMLFETIVNQGGSYGFVSPLRVGYGVIWTGICLMLYHTRIYDWLKASILAGSLATLMVGIGVQFFEKPIIVGIVMLVIVGICVFLLRKTNKKWYHYYAILISIIATLFYL